MTPPTPEIEGHTISAKLEILHREIVSFSTEWFRLEVLPERVLLSTTQGQYYEPMRDLALGTFRILRHTPITKMGINRDFHFRMPSEEAWHAIGHRLAPKDAWKDVLLEPGMASLSMQGRRPDQHQGAINVKVEPSNRVKPGVFISVNDHYEPTDVKDVKSVQGADSILDILESSWRTSIQRSQEIAQRVVGIK